VRRFRLCITRIYYDYTASDTGSRPGGDNFFSRSKKQKRLKFQPNFKMMTSVKPGQSQTRSIPQELKRKAQPSKNIKSNRNMQQTTTPDLEITNGKQQLSRCCFTFNNYTAVEYEWLKAFECKWMIIGKEVGANGTPHLQGAVVLKNRRLFSTLKKTIGFKRAHMEEMKGSVQDSIKYCTKEDKNAFQKGAVEPGKRNDIHSAINKLKDATSITDLVLKDDDFAATYVKYPNGLTNYRNMLEGKREGPPVVFWIYGDTGTGKTHSSVEWAERRGLDYWMSLGGLQWFNGYDGEPVAILDDFRTGHCKFSFLLRLLDRYRFSVPYKGGFRNWIPKVIFITAPLKPRDMFDLKKEGDIQQLERRIAHTIHSPVTVEQLEQLTIGLLDRTNPPMVEEPAVHGDTGGNGDTQIIDLSGTTCSEDDETSSSSSSSSEQFFEKNKKNIKPGLKRKRAYIDLTQASEEDEREGEKLVNKNKKNKK